MSQADRKKWNARYAEGAFAQRTHPSELLERWLARLPVGRAMDIACGAGRNSLYLAAAGFEVDAFDISARGLERAAATARAQGLQISWMERDLESGLPDSGLYDLIIMFRYVNIPLLGSLGDRLRPGGYLVVEEHLHMDSDTDVIGPSGPRFRVEPGALARAAGDLHICFSEEGVVTDPDGRRAAVARLVARRD